MESKIEDGNAINMRLAILGKGFSVTRSSGEFQLLVPNDIDNLDEKFEKDLIQETDWAGLISNLYRFDEESALKERLLLIYKDGFAVLKFCPTTDDHKRNSVLVVLASCDFNDSENIDLSLFDKCEEYAGKLCSLYAQAFKRDREVLGQQLKKGEFLSDRVFELNSDGEVGYWMPIVENLKLWKGISGFATPIMKDFGANVLIGTEREVTVSRNLQTAGYFDVRDKEIHPLGNHLERFEPESEVEEQPIDRIENSLERIEEKVENINRRLGEGHKTILDEFENVFVKILKNFLGKK